ncbi:MAG: hypothetical protein A6F71_10930 [Cycloclasticus sp. symbiont of Poecilosclerida sp. M]|nr:MAG: hypothetical protein A6F71_10930 [Cycloclasticus sp. symbiont of Poecilosclerida sp. M]
MESSWKEPRADSYIATELCELLSCTIVSSAIMIEGLWNQWLRDITRASPLDWVKPRPQFLFFGAALHAMCLPVRRLAVLVVLLLLAAPSQGMTIANQNK